MKTKAILIIAMFLLGISVVSAEPAVREKEKLEFSPIKEFQRSISYYDECYLLCVYSAKAEPRADGRGILAKGGWEQIAYGGTVVNVIKGSCKVGDTLNFVRVREGKAGDTSKMLGRLYYVFRSKGKDGTMHIDIQDPMAMWSYSKEYASVARKHVRDSKTEDK